MLLLFFAGGVQDGMCFDGCAAFVPIHDRHAGTFFQRGAERAAFFRAFPLRRIHIFRQTHHDFFDFFRRRQRCQLFQQLVCVPGRNDLRGAGEETGRVGDGYAGTGIAVINSHDLHVLAFPFRWWYGHKYNTGGKLMQIALHFPAWIGIMEEQRADGG